MDLQHCLDSEHDLQVGWLLPGCLCARGTGGRRRAAAAGTSAHALPCSTAAQSLTSRPTHPVLYLQEVFMGSCSLPSIEPPQKEAAPAAAPAAGVDVERIAVAPRTPSSEDDGLAEILMAR